MAAATRHVSPTAQLLRSSRLFALPSAIPPPPDSQLGAGGGGGSGSSAASRTRPRSDTATQPYPTRQAIATPESSLARGDWGLKRRLPLRSTTSSSAPTFVVKRHDTLEHITDYETAGPHVMSLRKWQEMDVPVAADVPQTRITQVPGFRSAFEPELDNTVVPGEGAATAAGERPGAVARWKFEGPLLNQLSNEEFEFYIRTRVRARKAEFLSHLKAHFRQKDIKALRARLTAEGAAAEEDLDPATLEARVPQLSDEAFLDKLRLLRSDLSLHSELAGLLSRFLDLPSAAAPPTASAADRRARADAFERASYATFDDDSATATASSSAAAGAQAAGAARPRTHPSAGLSYLRASSVTANHASLGPQASRAPVLARVLHARDSSLGQFRNARVGVAGFVAVDLRQKPLGGAAQAGAGDGLDVSDFAAPGGRKVWAVPRRALVAGTGAVRLDVEGAGVEAVAVAEGRLAESEALGYKTVPEVRGLARGGRWEGLLDKVGGAEEEGARGADGLEQADRRKGAGALFGLNGGPRRNAWDERREKGKRSGLAEGLLSLYKSREGQ
ncbi:mitochondrial ribosomal protein MRP51 [Lineolata rhizophorae]|uniref:Mitochondrial ribosomal protein MRP51 n=1 Tax=Lineolata rhizophorae TaxID=578093 RepID=A0A6A6NTS9_9PEZI|nr:mitochondrial ribosomal protein MRP51 [Lineolata rhizophorae]